MSWATVQSEDNGKERTTLCVGNSQIDLKWGGLKMKYEKVIVEVGQNYVAEITLNRPEQLNALDSQMAEELYQALMNWTPIQRFE